MHKRDKVLTLALLACTAIGCGSRTISDGRSGDEHVFHALNQSGAEVAVESWAGGQEDCYEPGNCVESPDVFLSRLGTIAPGERVDIVLHHDNPLLGHDDVYPAFSANGVTFPSCDVGAPEVSSCGLFCQKSSVDIIVYAANAPTPSGCQ
jgi:hypothetical protein